jgi:hypothetical protein
MSLEVYQCGTETSVLENRPKTLFTLAQQLLGSLALRDILYNGNPVCRVTVRGQEDDTGTAPNDFAVLTDVSLLPFVGRGPPLLGILKIRSGLLAVISVSDFQYRPALPA